MHQLTRKQFLGRIAGAGVAAAAAVSPVAASLPAKAPGVRPGVALLCFTGGYASTSLLEACVAAVGAAGAEGVEIAADRHIPGYPHPSGRWVEEWHAWMRKYHTAPSCYCCPETPAEAAGGRMRWLPALRQDMDLANRLGFRIVQPGWSHFPAARWSAMAQRALPLAHQLDIKLALGSPPDPAALAICREQVARDTSGRLGIAAEGSVRDPLPPSGVFHVRTVVRGPSVFRQEEHSWQLHDTRGPEKSEFAGLARRLATGGYSGYISVFYDGPHGIFPASSHLARPLAELREWS